MYQRQIKEINTDLTRTGKAIISIGCSFVQGQGAVNDELYVEYKWNSSSLGEKLQIVATSVQKMKLLKKYQNLCLDWNSIDFTFMEYDNSFVSVLCNNYFNKEYTPINLGMGGRGNRASISELYLQPDIDWSLIKECIVVYCPSGLERFDFVNDQWGDHFRWTTMWPQHANSNVNSSDFRIKEELWNGYGKFIYSEKFEVLEQILYLQTLVSWCKLHNAQLIITPGFDMRYNKKNFEESLDLKVERGKENQVAKKYTSILNSKSNKKLVNLWPWDKMFEPSGHTTFAKLAMAQETLSDTTDHFFQFLQKGSPEGWITPCAHPGAKAHDLFAKLLYQHISSI